MQGVVNLIFLNEKKNQKDFLISGKSCTNLGLNVKPEIQILNCISPGVLRNNVGVSTSIKPFSARKFRIFNITSERSLKFSCSHRCLKSKYRCFSLWDSFLIYFSSNLLYLKVIYLLIYSNLPNNRVGGRFLRN